MTVQIVTKPPRGLYVRPAPGVGQSAPTTPSANGTVGPECAQAIAEIFQTPLTGAYAWSYEEGDRKIRRLY